MPTGDGQTKIYGNYGIFYARIPNDLAARALSADDGFTRGDYFDAEPDAADSARDVTQVPAGGDRIDTNHFILAGVGADTIDPNAKLSYTNEVVLGIERELTPQHDDRRALRLPQHAARARGRGELPDGGVRTCRDVRRLRQRRIHPDEPDQLRHR